MKEVHEDLEKYGTGKINRKQKRSEFNCECETKEN